MEEVTVQIEKKVILPNIVKLERFRRIPELGPKVLFFSGGSALKEVSRLITDYTHNSIHIITPFDSGGSSAEIRKNYSMLSVGDLRNRIMSLAERSLTGNKNIYKLFNYRLSKDEDHDSLEKELLTMAQGTHKLVQVIDNPLQRIIKNHIYYFLDQKTSDFNLAGASIGNLILTGGYLNNRRHIEPVLFMFTKLVNALGEVRPVTGSNLHLVAEFDDRNKIIGQHLITGKEVAPLCNKIINVYLTKDVVGGKPYYISVKDKIKQAILDADLICYPFGSFYTSVIANLLPTGVGKAIVQSGCPKVFIPNPTDDVEQFDMSFVDLYQSIIRYVRKDCGESEPVKNILNFILLDSENGSYGDLEEFKSVVEVDGVQVIDTKLITEESYPFYDATNINKILLSLT